MLTRIADLAQRQAMRLQRLESQPGLSGARQLGTIAAVEIGGESGYLSDLAPRLLALFRDADLLLRPLGNTVYVMPPYCIADGDLDHIYALLEEASRLG